MAAGQPCCLIGDSGTGKSHLLIVLGTAAGAGCRVRYVTAAALVKELVEAADDKTLSRTITGYGRIDLLCLDELGLGAPMSQARHGDGAAAPQGDAEAVTRGLSRQPRVKRAARPISLAARSRTLMRQVPPVRCSHQSAAPRLDRRNTWRELGSPGERASQPPFLCSDR
ncbi:MAG TPA: ATP-binding protein [Streptosporangiaceae bacterium]|nr:ATP-binding protein [Streptosporangiaceae bacterium]